MVKYNIYLLWLLKQASVSGIILCISGLFFLICQKEKRLTFILILSYVFSSFLFLFIANVIKDVPVVLGALERFYMLPMVLIALFSGLGVYYITQCISFYYKQHPKKRIFFHAIIAIMIIPAVFLNLSNIRQHNSSIFYNYGRNVLNSLEQNAIILTQGDTPTHVLYYLQQVEGLRKDINILVKHHFNNLWYKAHLKKFHPLIQTPNAEANNIEATIKQFMIANLNKRPIYDTDFITKIPEENAGYKLISTGIVTKVTPPNLRFNEQDQIQIKSLWETYNTSDLSVSYPLNSLEKELSDLYASYHSVFAFQYLQFGLYDEAIDEYDKAIHLNATLASAYKNTGIIYDMHKHDPKKAVHYFKKYRALEPKDQDFAMLALIKEHSMD